VKPFQAMGRCCGSVALDLDLLKQRRVLASADAQAQQAPKIWLEYAYCKHHPVLQWLPTKLAEWIGENLQDDLGFPDKADPRRGWTPAELNNILDRHVVRDRNGCSLLTFGCLEWESEIYRGVMRARCYPFKMRKHSYRGMNPQVNYS
jgi:hypothetical protein